MKKDWLWDRRIGLSEARKILSRPEDDRFILIASLLLARKPNPREVFKDYLDPVLFCKEWHRIKKKMRQDRWGGQRLIFWQAIYEKLLDRYRKKGMKFRDTRDMEVRDPVCEAVGKEIHRVRKEKDLSQEQLAQKAGVSQQLISRIEKGKENISLITLKKISKALGRIAEISFV
jgi:DNA-binding XRE family transcriptional regulator